MLVDFEITHTSREIVIKREIKKKVHVIEYIVR